MVQGFVLNGFKSIWFVGYRLVFMAFLIILSVSTALAEEAAKEETGKEVVAKQVSLSGDHQKQQFLAAKRVEARTANVSDDIFAAGQDLIFDTVSAEHIIAAGMSLNFSDITADDLVLAGGQMSLSGDVRDDVIAAVCPFCPMGGRLHLTNRLQIGDDARLAGRDIAVDGRIGGHLFAASEQFTLSGEVVGNANIEAKRIVLTSTARIGGDLLYAGPSKPELLEGAVVSGEIRQVDANFSFADKKSPKNWVMYGILAMLSFILALLLLGSALQIAVPQLLSRAAETASEKPWASIGRGFALALLVPALVVLLLATLIGIPIGLVIMAAYFILLALAFISISYCIGLYVRKLLGKQAPHLGAGSRVLWTVSGILILMFIGLIPFLGWAISTLALLAGLGAVFSVLQPNFRSPKV